ncbi:hypothetical protein VE00_02689 [Pseudogymnoascus sp. WSF 3629]|nr:hypothetical protein VE00_02689 [Pseudogymnoascus sp. WSF 3629]
MSTTNWPPRPSARRIRWRSKSGLLIFEESWYQSRSGDHSWPGVNAAATTYVWDLGAHYYNIRVLTWSTEASVGGEAANIKYGPLQYENIEAYRSLAKRTGTITMADSIRIPNPVEEKLMSDAAKDSRERRQQAAQAREQEQKSAENEEQLRRAAANSRLRREDNEKKKKAF